VAAYFNGVGVFGKRYWPEIAIWQRTKFGKYPHCQGIENAVYFKS
jgi:hypothetical protein